MKTRFAFGVALFLVIIGSSLVGIAQESASTTDEPEVKVVAYYFHGDFRCATCRKLESYSKEAIETGFADAIAAGRLEFRPVNTDEKDNQHFLHDYQLVTKALVLVEYVDGEQTRWQDLKLIWKLVGDKDGFVNYVQQATTEFLAAG